MAGEHYKHFVTSLHVSSSIMAKFGVLIEFDKFSPKSQKKIIKGRHCGA